MCSSFSHGVVVDVGVVLQHVQSLSDVLLRLFSTYFIKGRKNHCVTPNEGEEVNPLRDTLLMKGMLTVKNLVTANKFGDRYHPGRGVNNEIFGNSENN